MRLSDLFEATAVPTDTMFDEVRDNPALIAKYYGYGDDLQAEAVRRDAFVIKHIPHPSRRVQMIAVEANPHVISVIPAPLPEAQIYAVQKNPDVLGKINDPCELAIEAAISRAGASALRHDNIRLTKEIVAFAIRKDPKGTVELFSTLPDDLQRLAFETDRGTIHLLRRLTNFSPEINAEYEQIISTEEKNWKDEHRLPVVGKRRSMPGVNHDQMVILRWMELNDRDSITVKELKQQSWGNTPYAQELVKATGGRDITREDVLANPGLKPAQDILRKCSVGITSWTRGEQRIFLNQRNYVAVYGMPGRDFGNISYEEKALLHHVYTSTPHPIIAKKPNFHATGLSLDGALSFDFNDNTRYTVGWVRFTMFDKDIWIDEVQSDLFKLLKPENILPYKGIQEAILIDFIARMRKRGAERFFMPTYDMKRSLYAADPPQSVYVDLPKKMRMKKTVVSGISDVVDGREAWLLEGLVRR